jgi:phosphonate degradation associated HDIG domain protein
MTANCPLTPADEVLALFANRGASAYFGECVSMTAHCLQAAHFAQAAGASPALILAALLHDVGHLLDDVPADLADWQQDLRHEEIGSRWLAQRFPPEVSEPVRLHVPAKRYLCATDDRYLAKLSPASVVTLKLQGGSMTADEVAQFECQRFHRDAIRLRHWDDRGKVAGLATRAVGSYGPLLERFSQRRTM